jgi:hypothetical protein
MAAKRIRLVDQVTVGTHLQGLSHDRREVEGDGNAVLRAPIGAIADYRVLGHQVLKRYPHRRRAVGVNLKKQGRIRGIIHARQGYWLYRRENSSSADAIGYKEARQGERQCRETSQPGSAGPAGAPACLHERCSPNRAASLYLMAVVLQPALHSIPVCRQRPHGRQDSPSQQDLRRSWPIAPLRNQNGSVAS